jgi:death-on-curing protein
MIKFLNKALVLQFHSDQVRRYGGLDGLRDETLLDSALAQAEASYDGVYLHTSIFKMAAAYGFHLAKNHPFLDGNKRIALISIYTFLYMNGYQLKADNKALYMTILGLADAVVSKNDLAEFLEENCKPR